MSVSIDTLWDNSIPPLNLWNWTARYLRGVTKDELQGHTHDSVLEDEVVLRSP